MLAVCHSMKEELAQHPREHPREEEASQLSQRTQGETGALPGRHPCCVRPPVCASPGPISFPWCPVAVRGREQKPCCPIFRNDHLLTRLCGKTNSLRTSSHHAEDSEESHRLTTPGTLLSSQKCFLSSPVLTCCLITLLWNSSNTCAR